MEKTRYYWRDKRQETTGPKFEETIWKGLEGGFPFSTAAIEHPGGRIKGGRMHSPMPFRG